MDRPHLLSSLFYIHTGCVCADELPLPPMNELIPSSRVQANEFVNEFQTNELEKGVDELNQLEIIYSGDIFEEID